MERTGAHLTARGAATRARIVDAAAALMYEDGVSRTSLDAVLTASGTSKSQLYHYFTDKDELVLAVIERQTEVVVGGQQPFLDRLDSLDGLRRWRDAVVELQRRRGCAGGCPIGTLAADLAEDDRARARLDASFATWESYFVRGLATMRDRGDLMASSDPEALAVAMMAALQGGLLLAQTTRSTQPLEVALDMALAHIASELRLDVP